MTIKFSHRGICISDMARSERFYREALGFVDYQDHGMIAGPEMSKTTQLPDVVFACKMLRLADGPVIELLEFQNPKAFGPRERRSILQYGLVHLSFYVDDIDASAQRILAAGGQVFDETRAEAPGGVTLLYCTDPDGIRIELMHHADVPARFSHNGICVQDIDLSLKYYEALGFEPAENYLLDQGFDWLGTITEVPDIKLRAQMISDKDGNVIELLKAIAPASFGSLERRALNQYGLTHLAFWDDNPDGTAQALTLRGGHFVAEAHIETPQIELQHGADPDGVRIELMRLVASE